MSGPRLRAVWLGVLVVAAVFAGVFLWRHAVRPHVLAKNFGVVVPGQIYRSGELSAASMERVIETHGVRTVIDLGTHEPGSADERREQRVCDVLGVERHRMQLSGDATGDPNYYVEALRIMSDPSKRPVLVHCGAGSERTSCAVILYRHIIEGKAIDDVYHEAYDHKHRDARNPHLRAVLNEWTDEIGAAYRDGRRIPFGEAAREPAFAGRP